jgi:hypothetical protein
MSMMPLPPRTLDTLRALLQDLQEEALRVGRYPPPHTADRWAARDRRCAFQCIAYRRYVRQINALTRVLTALSSSVRPLDNMVGVRDPDFPCEQYCPGNPTGDCETDGPYLCHQCVNKQPDTESGESRGGM